MLLTSSTGPNGVLTECQLKYGENRINLFFYLFYHKINKKNKLLYILMLKQHPNQQLEYYLVILNDITLIL